MTLTLSDSRIETLGQARIEAGLALSHVRVGQCTTEGQTTKKHAYGPAGGGRGTENGAHLHRQYLFSPLRG